MTDVQSQLHTFTLHVDFLAGSEDQARQQAAVYADGLIQLRPEVDGYPASVTQAETWSRPTAVFCAASGVDAAATCTDILNHGGWHHGPGGRWSDENEVVPP